MANERTWRDAVNAELFSHLHLGLTVWEKADDKLRFVCGNGYAERILGTKLEGLEKCDIDHVIPDGQLRSAITDLWDRAGGDKPAEANPVFFKREGDTLTLDLQAFCLPAGQVGVAMRDVTGSHEIRRKLKRRSEQLGESQSFNHVGSWDWDIADDTVTWSDELYRIFGLVPQEFPATYQAYLDRIHPDDRATVQTMVAHTLETHEPFREYKRIVRPDGTVRTLDSCGRVQLDEATGKPVMLFGTCLDVTERLEREGALRRSEERYRKLFEDDLTGNFLADGNGAFLAVNPALATMFGLGTVEQALARGFADLCPDDDTCKRLLARLLKEGHLDRVDLRLRHTDGRSLDVIGNFVADRLNDGLHQFHGYLFDLTEHRKTEQQLRHMQKMDAVGRLAGGVAHDFNNLLTVVLNYTDVLKKKVGHVPGADAALEAIAEAADSAAVLTRQLLTVGRGQLVERQSQEINEVVKDAERLLHRILGENVAVETHGLSEPAYVEMGGGQLEQILLNLAVNAREAMPDGGRLILEASLVELSGGAHGFGQADGSYVMLRVSDTGVGMTQEVQSHIFEPFFSTKTRGQNSGLGLSTVYGIVKQAGGDIGVHSEPGQGTTIKVLLPRSGPGRSSQPMPEVRARTERGEGKVLVVEDAARLRTLVEEVLGGAGYTVKSAETAEQALELVTGFQPDVVLTDVVLPGHSGPELVRQLRARWPTLRVVYMSGYSRRVAVGTEPAMPTGRYLAKPFTPDQLLSHLQAAMTDAPTDQEPAQPGEIRTHQA